MKATFIATLVTVMATVAASQLEISSAINVVVQEMNKLRKEKRVPPLCYSDKLAQSAQVQSLYQARVGQMTHDNPLDISGRMLAVGFAVKDGYAAENVGKAMGLNGGKMFEGWKNSPHHLENMVNEKYNFVGIAVVQPDKPGKRPWYWTVHFAEGTSAEVCGAELLNDQNLVNSPPTVANIVSTITPPPLDMLTPPTPTSQVVLEINSLMESLINQSDAPPTVMPTVHVTTLLQSAAEFIPATITATSILTISMISTLTVPTTILKMLTVTEPAAVCPSVSCPVAPPCTCSECPLLHRPTIVPTSSVDSFTPLLIEPTSAINTLTKSDPIIHSSIGTATVLILSNSSVHFTTTIPPNTKPVLIQTPTAKTVYQCPTMLTITTTV